MQSSEFEKKQEAIFTYLVGDKANMARTLIISFLESLVSTEFSEAQKESHFDSQEYVSSLLRDV